jgi:hypothetical protein
VIRVKQSDRALIALISLTAFVIGALIAIDVLVYLWE